MPNDQYESCPCGSGKKIKFCCVSIHNEMEKIERMIEGEQRLACLTFINGLTSEQQQTAYVFAIKAMLLARLGKTEEAAATLEAFLEKHPGNPVALAEMALHKAQQDEILLAVRLVHQALECVDKECPAATYEAIAAMAQLLFAAGHPYAGRAHLMLQASLSGGKDQRVQEMWSRINSDANLPLFYKDDPRLVAPPEDAPYKEAMDEVMKTSARASWPAAADLCEKLTESFPDVPDVWRNLATLRTFCADDDGAVAALQKYAAMDVSIDDAIEAEARASILIRDESVEEPVDLLMFEYPVNDLEALHPHLSTYPKCVSMGVDPARLTEPGQPPPKDAYYLLDQAAPDESESITLKTVPNILGEVLLFGRETDRPARIELVVDRINQEASQAALTEACGQKIDRPGEEKQVGSLPRTQLVLSWKWRMPEDVTPERQKELFNEKRDEVLLKDWSALPMKRFDGKSPTDAAQDPKLQIKVLAAILMLETSSSRQFADFDYNQLRTQLGLPLSGPVDPEQIDLDQIAIARLSRLIPDKLTDEQLVQAFGRAAEPGFGAAANHLGEEILARESLADKIDRASLYADLAQLSSDSESMLQRLSQAQEAAKTAGQSPARWYLQELPLRIVSGAAERTEELLQLLNGHLDEPGVAMGVQSVLSQFGLISPGQMPPGQMPLGQAPPGMTPPVTGPPADGGMWAPGGEPAKKPAEKSALWLPGMD